MQGSTVRTTSNCYLMNVVPGATRSSDAQLPKNTNNMYYEEKIVGSTSFYKCEACPYMAFAEDDIKFHLFTAHLELAKINGLADNISIPCPGCAEVFDAENTLRTHLREHHKMGIRDVRKMVKSLIQVALKHKQESSKNQPSDPPPPPPPPIPQVIEIIPDIVQSNNVLPSSVTVISMDELHKMSTPDFEKVDPKEIIQEASINIVYSEELLENCVSNEYTGTLSNVAPDIISSTQCSKSPHKTADTNITPAISIVTEKQNQTNEPLAALKPKEHKQKQGTKCASDGCGVRLVSEEKLAYHASCHHNGKLQCPECKRIYLYTKELHTHLWKAHDIDMELHACELCDYKSYSLSRLNNIHKKTHSKQRDAVCPVCGKTFKSSHQLSVHKGVHRVARRECEACGKTFVSDKQLRRHALAVHQHAKPFRCDRCDFATARKCSLKTHLRSHSGDNVYKCDRCDFSSIDHNSMRRHKLQHTNEKKYKCKHCSYACIQSQSFLNHMRSQHPDTPADDVFSCGYCKFQSVNRDQLMKHLLVHNRESQEGQQFVLDLNNSQKKSNWNTPADDGPKNWNSPAQSKPIHWTVGSQQSDWNAPGPVDNEQKTSWNSPEAGELCAQSVKTDSALSQPAVPDDAPTNLSVPIEVDDCDSEHDPAHFPLNYSYMDAVVLPLDKAYHIQEILTDLTKDDNNSDCLISESSNDTVNNRHHFPPLPMDSIDSLHASNLRDYLDPAVTVANNLILQNSNVDVITSNSYDSNRSSIMNNFPIYLPPRITIRRNLTLTPADKIPLPVPKVTGPVINQNGVVSTAASRSPAASQAGQSAEQEAAPRKKAKISVKSNLILKGPDQINMFNSEENMVFRRLEDGERMNLSSPVTFNNLITTCMQMPPEPVTGNSEDALNDLPPYTHDALLADANMSRVKDNRLFTFNRQIDLNSINMMPQEASHSKMSIICGNPNFIKLESKQNIQSPSLEKMCNGNTEIIKSQEISDVYCKASPRLEDLQKNVNEIKNEIKSDAYFNMTSHSSPSAIDRHLMEAIIDANEIYAAHLDLSGVVLQEMPEQDQQPDVIEIDDNSEDNKLLPPRYSMSYPIEYTHDFYCLESEISQTSSNATPTDANQLGKVTADAGSELRDAGARHYDNFIHSQTDPMLNTCVRPLTNKINVKNIELMKN